MNKLLSKNKILNIAIILMIAIFFIFDRYLKNIAQNNIIQGPYKLIGDFFSFSFSANRYMAFSIPVAGWALNTIILLIITSLVIYIFYLILNKKYKNYTILLLTILLLGAISNILDRLLYGYVIDYLELRYFTVFNLADVMISLSALILIIKNLKK